jgi:hypothetical protein
MMIKTGWRDSVLWDPAGRGLVECLGLHASLDHLRDGLILDERAAGSPAGEVVAFRINPGTPGYEGFPPVANLQQQSAATKAQPGGGGCDYSRLTRRKRHSVRPTPRLCKQDVRVSSESDSLTAPAHTTSAGAPVSVLVSFATVQQRS